MNNNATQDNASASRLFPPTKDEEDSSSCISRLQESRRPPFPEAEEMLKQLDQIRYSPRQTTVKQILNYAEQTLKNEENKPH